MTIGHSQYSHFWGNAALICSLLLSLSLLTACNQAGGAFEKQPHHIHSARAEVHALLRQSLSDVDPGALTDYHTHIIGMSPQTIGTFVNADWQSWLNPVGYIKFQVYKSASGVTGKRNIDQQFMRRLNSLIEHLPYPGRFGIMAFDYFHDERGVINKQLTTFHVPNDYVLELAAAQPQRYFPIISVHPYRQDAVATLQRYARRGVRFIKWLPNSMGIHPSAKADVLRRRLTDYYQVMRDNDMVLISHTGDEHAINADELQHLGNPLYLRLPLDLGVTVIMAHVGSTGECGKKESGVCVPGTPYLDIAIQMMREYRRHLFADISAITQYNRLHALDKIIDAADIHGNLVNGSDYPLPAVNFVIRTGALVKSGHITATERELINELYHINPLLFDYVLKRTVKHSKTGQRLPASIFMRNDKLPMSDYDTS